jgi:hypothetical protein
VDISGFSITNALNITGTGTVTAANLTATGGTLKLFDTAAPAFFGDTVYDSGTGRLVVLPQGVAPEFVAYLSDIPQVYQATYYKSAVQNLASGNTDITFDLTGAWNNDGGYITQTAPTDFTVVQAGLYQLGFNATILVNNGTWVSTNRNIGIDITRSPTAEQAVIQNSALQGVQNYTQSTSGTYYLQAGDIINLRVGNTWTGGIPTPPQAQATQTHASASYP